jgi:cephalosporin hydroxylase
VLEQPTKVNPMALKELLPLSLRNQARPAVQQFRKWRTRMFRGMTDASFWPRPAAWHQLRREIATISDTAALYRISAREFGILQIENEIVPFLNYLRESHPVTVGEIGLKHGGNTFMFTRLFTEATHIIGLDLELQNTSKMRFLARPGQRIDLLEGNSYSKPIIERTRQILGGKQFDVLFIDGDHEYAGVKADFEAYYDMVRPGGLIGFHDIVPDEVARTGTKSPTSLVYGGGVYKLWAELKTQYEHREFVNDWNQHGFGIGVLVKK